MKIIELIKNLFRHECMFYVKEVMDLKQDPKCWKCGKPLSVAQAEKPSK